MMNRMRLLIFCALACGLLLPLFAAPSRAQQDPPPPPPSNDDLEDDEPGEVELADGPWVGVLGKCKDINEKEPQLVRVEFKDANDNVRDKRKYFVRWDRLNEYAGGWVVLEIWCPHLKCAVQYDSDQGVFRCPCCNSEFALDGRLLSGRAKKPLNNLSSEIYEESGFVKLEIEPEVEDP